MVDTVFLEKASVAAQDITKEGIKAGCVYIVMTIIIGNDYNGLRRFVERNKDSEKGTKTHSSSRNRTSGFNCFLRSLSRDSRINSRN